MDTIKINNIEVSIEIKKCLDANKADYELLFTK